MDMSRRSTFGAVKKSPQEVSRSRSSNPGQACRVYLTAPLNTSVRTCHLCGSRWFLQTGSGHFQQQFPTVCDSFQFICIRIRPDATVKLLSPENISPRHFQFGRQFTDRSRGTQGIVTHIGRGVPVAAGSDRHQLPNPQGAA